MINITTMWIDKYFELMFSSKKRNIKLAHELKNNHFPNSLYKYKYFDDNNHTLDLLKTDLIFLSKASTLNDPYEGEIFYDKDILYDHYFYKDILPNFFKKAKLNKNQIEQIIFSENPKKEQHKFIYENDSSVNKEIPIEEHYNKSMEINKKYFDYPIKKIIKQRKEEVYLTCFSKTNTINPMWAHYAYNHTGICIEYNIKDLNEEYVSNWCYPVKYEDNYDYTKELMNIKDNGNKLLHETLLKKSTEWKYEKEWRILIDYDIQLSGLIKKESDYFLKLPKPQAIYLGINISNKNKEKILKICEDREISAYQMEINRKNHQLKTRNIKKYPMGKWNETEYIIDCIQYKSLRNLLKKYFFKHKTKEEQHNDFSRIINSFSKLSPNEITYFLDTILFNNEIFPVLYPYYYNVLLFLNHLNEIDKFNKYKTSDGLNISENIQKWTGNLISNFYFKKIIRYMIFYEKLFMRFYNRYVILDKKEKEKYESQLKKYAIKNDYVTLIEKPDKTLIHPFSNPSITELIKEDILQNLEILITSYYKHGIFNECLCYNEYKTFNSMIIKLENLTCDKYNKIYENSKLPFIYDWIFNEYYDNTLHFACKTLKDNPHLLTLISFNDEELLKNIAIINYNADKQIANFAEKCCDELNLNYKKIIPLKDIFLNYFNPKFNPYKIFE